MLRKTYGVPGKIETVMVLKAGNNDVVVNFKGGSIVDFARKPASYSTTNPIYQAIIENSAQFKRGEIKLLGTIEVGGEHHAAAGKKSGAKEYPEVTGTQKAIEVLKSLSADTTGVKTKADAKRIAAELNISFPNL